jgi:uncharacterized protein (TIGR02145 family)
MKPAIIENYTYNGFGQLTQRKQVSSRLGAKEVESFSYNYNVYTYPNTTTTNPSTITIFGGNAMGKTGSPQQIKLLTYDNKKNIGGAFPGTMDDYETFATNNVISADITFVTADEKETRVTTYEYNESGYPISKTYKANGGITFTDIYTYSCSGTVNQPSSAGVLPNQKTKSSSPITLGTQVWDSKNLDSKMFANGDPIAQAQSNEEWIKAGNERRPAWCYYESDAANGAIYGILYNCFAVSDPRGLAPKGWHIPTKYEWITAFDYLGGKNGAGYKLKSTTRWQNVAGINRNGSDANGFGALPAGLRFADDGKFDALGTRCQFWTATENESVNGAIVLFGISNDAEIGIANKKFGYSVRCMKD